MTDAIPVLSPGRYRHYKGHDYAVLHTARHSETEELLVVYRTLYGDFSWWVRPYDMFTSTIVIDGVETPRFAYIGPLESEAFAAEVK
jgi:hypothetical protein